MILVPGEFANLEITPGEHEVVSNRVGTCERAIAGLPPA
jgi:hypothetical protein